MVGVRAKVRFRVIVRVRIRIRARHITNHITASAIDKVIVNTLPTILDPTLLSRIESERSAQRPGDF